ncbi:MAG: hypothetical protein WC799_17310 [Desulfobacteraceae bacterium]|jgi:hypothetical protein
MNTNRSAFAAALVFFLFGLVSCGESDLPEDYVSVSPKILAVKISDPEVLPGDTVTMRLLVSGKDMDQNSDMAVVWTVGTVESGVYVQTEAPYNTDYPLEIPSGILDVLGASSVDVPVTASVTIGGKVLSALKRFRICLEPIGKNPEITGVQADFMAEGEHQTVNLSQGDTLSLDNSYKAAAFTAMTTDLPEGANQVLIYSWYMTPSSNSLGELFVYDDKTNIEALLGQGAMAAEFRPSVMFSLFGEDAEEKYQKGRYHVYMIVRDNAATSSDSTEDRLGTDFFYFTLDLL